jgi:hypothetical protein
MSTMASAFREIANTASCRPATVSTSEWLSADNDKADAGAAVQYMSALEELAGRPGGGLKEGGVKSDGRNIDDSYQGIKSIAMSRSTA